MVFQIKEIFNVFVFVSYGRNRKVEYLEPDGYRIAFYALHRSFTQFFIGYYTAFGQRRLVELELRFDKHHRFAAVFEQIEH